MDFTQLIRKYEVLLTVKKTSGRYVNGIWTKGFIEKQFMGTFLPLNSKDLRYYEAGTYTVQDKKLFVLEGLKDTEGNDLVIEDGDFITKDGVTEYKVSSDLSAEQIVNYRRYLCKKKVEE